LQWGCQVPPEPAHSVSTLSASRPQGATPPTHRVCFTPATLLSLPSGFSATRRGERVSTLLPPVPFCLALRRGVRLRRVEPSGEPDHPSESPGYPRTLLALSPLRLSLPPPQHRLPGASSLALCLPLSRALKAEAHSTRASSRGTRLRVSPNGGPGCRANHHESGGSYRPLWGFPPGIVSGPGGAPDNA
jgi:hypothetical protein